MPPFKISLKEGAIPVLVPNFDIEIDPEAVNATKQAFSYKLCGVPGVCKLNAAEKCKNISLNHCSECEDVAFGFFIIFVLFLGLTIVSGNLLVLKVFYDLRKKQKLRKVDIYKTSLAVADLIAGLLIFFVAFPNLAWTINLSLDQITTEVVLLRDTPQSIVGSFFYLLGYTASLYHLILLGIMRLYAIRWPQRYNQLSNRSSYIGIGIAWSLAVLVATSPAWFPLHYSHDYSPIVFFYLPGLRIAPSSTSTHTAHAFSSLIIFSVLPFLMMTCIMIVTVVIARIMIRDSQKRLRLGKTSANNKLTKQEISTIKTVLSMQCGFTFTLLPVGILIALIYAGNLKCDGFSAVYVICFYLSRSNSLVNVLVYSVNEENFRTTLRESFWKTKVSLRVFGMKTMKKKLIQEATEQPQNKTHTAMTNPGKLAH